MKKQFTSHLLLLTALSLSCTAELQPALAQFQNSYPNQPANQNIEAEGQAFDDVDYAYAPGDDQSEQFQRPEQPQHREQRDGIARANLADLDGVVERVMQQYSVPGASLAVAKDGRLVYAKGFGVANLRTREPVTPDTLFNLASCTKAISAFGVLRLVDMGRLQLDAPFYDVIGRPPLLNGGEPGPRIQRITVRQLLHHSGGWNDDSGFMRASRAVKQMAPNGVPYADAVKVLLATPLDYPPGSTTKYANGQWNMIKYVIECAAQMPYKRFMREQLNAIGIHDMCEEQRGVIPGQASRYTGFPPHIVSGGQLEVPLMPSFGNWMASSVDLVKFLTAIDGSRVQGISREAFQQMIAPLPPPLQDQTNHFGLGMDSVTNGPLGVAYSKNGGKPGVHCQIVHMANGVNYCLQMNGGSVQGVAADSNDANPMGPANRQIKAVLNGVTEWPQIDMFNAAR